MQRKTLFILSALVLFGLIIGNTNPVAASTEEITPDVELSYVEFTGVVEAIDGDQVVVDGYTITIDPALIGGAGITIGDIIEIEAIEGENGKLTVKSISLENDTDNENSDEINDDNDEDGDIDEEDVDGDIDDDDDSDDKDDNNDDVEDDDDTDDHRDDDNTSDNDTNDDDTNDGSSTPNA